MTTRIQNFHLFKLNHHRNIPISIAKPNVILTENYKLYMYIHNTISTKFQPKSNKIPKPNITQFYTKHNSILFDYNSKIAQNTGEHTYTSKTAPQLAQ